MPSDEEPFYDPLLNPKPSEEDSSEEKENISVPYFVSSQEKKNVDYQKDVVVGSTNLSEPGEALDKKTEDTTITTIEQESQDEHESSEEIPQHNSDSKDSSSVQNNSQKSQKKKKSLFDDEDEDDELENTSSGLSALTLQTMVTKNESNVPLGEDHLFSLNEIDGDDELDSIESKLGINQSKDEDQRDLKQDKRINSLSSSLLKNSQNKKVVSKGGDNDDDDDDDDSLFNLVNESSIKNGSGNLFGGIDINNYISQQKSSQKGLFDM